MIRLLMPVLLCMSGLSGAAHAQSLQALFDRGMEAGHAGDYTSAFVLIRQAAEGGYAPAQYTLGTMYSAGQGAEPSRSEAAIWFERAAVQNHPLALYNLGLYYDLGMGVEQGPYFEAYGHFEAFLFVVRVLAEAEFEGHFEEGGGHFVFFEVVAAVEPVEGQYGLQGVELHIELLEEDVAVADAQSEGYG